MATRTERGPPKKRAAPPKDAPAGPAPPGLAAREVAVQALAAVLERGRAFDDALDQALARAGAALEGRDRGLARLIAATVLRRHGELAAVIGSFLERPLPEKRGRLTPILLSAAAQLLILDTPPHAAISIAVDQCRLDRFARRFDKLANAVLRRVAREGREVLAGLDAVALNIPAWLLARWRESYGEVTARRIAEASLVEAPLDLSVKADAAGWASRLGGVVLPTGSVRLAAHGRIEDLPGFAEGAWWVQDAAAALPARLLGDVAGRDVADLCAAPGGKTASLAAAGARVTAVDASGQRLQRLEANLARLGLAAEVIAADATSWQPGRLFDAVLLDAPCLATGTIRRHPDILHLKRATDVAGQAEGQARLLANAARLVKPGGTLVYCTCSLEPEEGVRQIEDFLASEAGAGFRRVPISASEIASGGEDWLTPAGDLRTLPFHMALASPAMSGMDGFYAARLVRSS